MLPKQKVSVKNVYNNSNDGFTANDKETANQSIIFFTSIGNSLSLASKFSDANSNAIEDRCKSDSKFQFDIIMDDYVFDQICNLSNYKSPGLDGFQAKVLKLAAPTICKPLAYKCNLSLLTSTFPFDWKQAKVTLIFKDGDKTDVGNYRPISVLSIVSKILERAVHDQLYSFLTTNSILHPSVWIQKWPLHKYGKYSTNTALLRHYFAVLLHSVLQLFIFCCTNVYAVSSYAERNKCYVMLCYVMLCYVMLCYVMLCYVMLCYVMLCYVMLDVSDFILNNMNGVRATTAIFLDLKKAFDTVNHDILISKLHCYGIKGSALNWFISYLTDTSQVVTINSHLSDSQNINIGVLHGSVLRPLLFIIYVNSLPDSVTCKCIMYADDTTLLCSSSDPISLQSDLTSSLTSIANWFKVNKLTLNVKKAKLMIFGTNN